MSEAEIETDPPSGQVYVQRKAELDDEGSNSYELAAKDEGHEIEADCRRYELSAVERWDGPRDLPELRGGEHAKELEAPQC